MTKQPKFTPGPWHKSTFEDDYAIRGAKCNRIIARPNCNFDDASANAALIAQCPNMIEFICDIVSACDYGTETLSEQFRKRGVEIIRKVYGTEGNND